MLTKTLQFEDDVLDVIRDMEWENEGCLGKITGQLDRPLYTRVNKALEAMGGEWNRKLGGHVFDNDPRLSVMGLLDEGTITVEKDGFFETPAAVVERMLELLPVEEGDYILEPSAGLGAIAQYLPMENTLCIEKNQQRFQFLNEGCYLAELADFMKWTPRQTDEPFDKIYMNPPFENLQDIDHVMRAYGFLRPGGAMIAVMSPGYKFRQDSKAKFFRDWLSRLDHEDEELPDGSFKESGTGVKSRLVLIRK